MKYGHFDDQNREYIISQPDTPLPWMNYLGCESYFGLISNTAGGYSFYRDARLRRLTSYRYNSAPFDVWLDKVQRRRRPDGVTGRSGHAQQRAVHRNSRFSRGFLHDRLSNRLVFTKFSGG